MIEKMKLKRISYTVVDSPVGDLLIAGTHKGLCAVRIGRGKRAMERQFKKDFSDVELIRDAGALKSWTRTLLNYLDGAALPEIPCDVPASAFQRRVWDQLRAIPSGKTRHYADVAAAIGQPRAVRAVARACASNPVALVIPCHRIVPKSGGIGGYRWHPRRKRQLLALESR